MEVFGRGRMAEYENDLFDCWGDWHRPNRIGDRRHFPLKTGGRMMRHPFYDPIIYPRTPDKTIDLGYDLQRRDRTSSVQTLSAMGTAHFIDPYDAVAIQEVWVADQLSTFTELVYQFRRYWVDPLPPGRYVGWVPRDRTPRRYHIEILGLTCGPPDEFVIEELGRTRPHMMREQLTITFRCVREHFHPAGQMVGVGL